MIISLIGGIGSGKTVSMIKEIIDSKNFTLTNFKLMGAAYHRIKYKDMLNYDPKGKRFTSVNWDFWDKVRKKHKNFSILLDEAHSIIGSRSSMTRRNQLLSNWGAQIRKILGDNPVNHLYICTQTPRKIDVNFRELTHVVIYCSKRIVRGNVWIYQRYYEGFDDFDQRRQTGKTFKFFANPYFKYYDSYKMVQFSDAEEFV